MPKPKTKKPKERVKEKEKERHHRKHKTKGKGKAKAKARSPSTSSSSSSSSTSSTSTSSTSSSSSASASPEVRHRSTRHRRHQKTGNKPDSNPSPPRKHPKRAAKSGSGERVAVQEESNRDTHSKRADLKTGTLPQPRPKDEGKDKSKFQVISGTGCEDRRGHRSPELRRRERSPSPGRQGRPKERGREGRDARDRYDHRSSSGYPERSPHQDRTRTDTSRAQRGGERSPSDRPGRLGERSPRDRHTREARYLGERSPREIRYLGERSPRTSSSRGGDGMVKDHRTSPAPADRPPQKALGDTPLYLPMVPGDTQSALRLVPGSPKNGTLQELVAMGKDLHTRSRDRKGHAHHPRDGHLTPSEIRDRVGTTAHNANLGTMTGVSAHTKSHMTNLCRCRTTWQVDPDCRRPRPCLLTPRWSPASRLKLRAINSLRLLSLLLHRHPAENGSVRRIVGTW